MPGKGNTAGITGANGFIAWHLRCAMHSAGMPEARLAGRGTFESPEALRSFVEDLDVIVHLAGVNRADNDADLESANLNIAQALVSAMEETQSTPLVIYASSTHESSDTPYGRSKRQAGSLLEDWAERSGARFSRFIIPHVFGEGGRPHYNSVVSTFCSQLASGEIPTVKHNGQLELVHAQDLADQIIAAYTKEARPEVRISGTPLSVVELLDRLTGFKATFGEHVIPRLDDKFTLRLFNTWRSYLYPEQWPIQLTLHSDERGTLFEGVKTVNGGQGFLSTTRPGVVRGGHYHRFKLERFLVARGEAEIRIRRLLEDDVRTFTVNGKQPCFIDIPTLHTHEIQNTGSEELLTFFWAHEIFDPGNPDTITAPVTRAGANHP